MYTYKTTVKRVNTAYNTKFLKVAKENITYVLKLLTILIYFYIVTIQFSLRSRCY